MAVVVSEWSAGFDGEFTTTNTGHRCGSGS